MNFDYLGVNHELKCISFGVEFGVKEIKIEDFG